MPVVKMTQSSLATLQVPEGKERIEWCDQDTPGLYLLATANGQVSTFFLRSKIEGRTTHQKIGRLGDLSLADARARAKQMKAEIALGANPRAEKKREKAILTYGEFFDNHYLPYVKPRKRSWKRDEELYRLRIKAVFGHVRMDQMARRDILALHTALLASGLAAASANLHLRLIRSSLNLAVEWQLLDKSPATRLKLFREDNKKQRLLNKEEMSRLVSVLRTDSNRNVGAIALLALSTACRLGEILSLKWSEVDLPKKVMTVTATNSKSKRARVLPLNATALEVCNGLETKGKFEYLFINPRTGRRYTTIRKVWDRLRRKAGLRDFRFHDMRHNAASILVDQGQSLYLVQTLLGHADSKTTMRYATISERTLANATAGIAATINGAPVRQTSEAKAEPSLSMD